MGIEPTREGILPTSVLKTVSITRTLAASVVYQYLPILTFKLKFSNQKINDCRWIVEIELWHIYL